MARDGERGRGDWKARRGSRNSGPYAGDGDTGPVDIVAVRRDDALIDAIASNGPVQTDSAEEYQLATLMADWRAELISPPLPGEPNLDEIVAAVNQEIGARQVRIGAQSGGRLRLIRPILGTAAALALVIGGLSAFSYGAAPGDPLWRVKEVVFSEQAQTTVVQRADSDLANAKSALDQRNPEQAKAKLEGAKTNAELIDDPVKKEKRLSELDILFAELAKTFPDIASSITSAAPTTKPAPAATDGTTAPTTKPKPGTDSSSVVIAPPVDTKPSTTTEPTAPDKPPLPTTQVPATAEPPTQPSQNHPTPATPTTVVTPPTVVEPTADTGVPAQPPTRPQSPTGGNTFVIPSGLPSMPGLPGSGPAT
ncbi:anti-sigma-D factor RsdA [Nocardia sp. NBC_00565]|uniref:anti-sigma-D factor RsdA n=1 Tax=Nocardia sp. NBC_00565 TaxID=2975993 RepID=UPI002E804D5A|nr:anti-sigma-D factor RsdA [Nocardia sp. NBC_00565]WUC02962.1 anti-sigma-D factor RsdA [Nocardia sp. NBC_00565]